jgi:hypothetical protein
VRVGCVCCVACPPAPPSPPTHTQPAKIWPLHLIHTSRYPTRVLEGVGVILMLCSYLPFSLSCAFSLSLSLSLSHLSHLTHRLSSLGCPLPPPSAHLSHLSLRPLPRRHRVCSKGHLWTHHHHLQPHHQYRRQHQHSKPQQQTQHQVLPEAWAV